MCSSDLKTQIRIVRYAPNLEETKKAKPPFNLDLQFLLNGTDYFPLSELTAYERYLIYLKYKEGKTIVQISQVVQKERHTVSSHMKKATEKLRSLKNAINDTR